MDAPAPAALAPRGMRRTWLTTAVLVLCALMAASGAGRWPLMGPVRRLPELAGPVLPTDVASPLVAVAGWATLPLTIAAGWVQELWMLTWPLGFRLLPALFPDGRVAAPRWRRPVQVTAAAAPSCIDGTSTLQGQVGADSG